MKLLKKIDIKNNKVLLGLFALLFMGSAAQTLAILSSQQKSAQSAQVLNYPTLNNSNQNGCLEFTYNYNRVEPFLIPSEDIGDGFSQYLFKTVGDFKNTCSYPINILNSSGLSPRYMSVPDDNEGEGGRVTELVYEGLQILGSYEPQNIELSNDLYHLTASQELFGCYAGVSDCTQSSQMVSTPSSYSNDGQIQTFRLNPQQSYKMVINSIIVAPDNFPYPFRTKLKIVKWARSSSLSDGVLSVNEIEEKRFTATESNLYAHDFIRVAYNAGLVGEGSEIKSENTDEYFKEMMKEWEVKILKEKENIKKEEIKR